MSAVPRFICQRVNAAKHGHAKLISVGFVRRPGMLLDRFFSFLDAPFRSSSHFSCVGFHRHTSRVLFYSLLLVVQLQLDHHHHHPHHQHPRSVEPSMLDQSVLRFVEFKNLLRLLWKGSSSVVCSSFKIHLIFKFLSVLASCKLFLLSKRWSKICNDCWN